MKRSKSPVTVRIALACAALAFSMAACAQAQIVINLANFDGKNGSGPVGLIQATDGNFYGTTELGGAHGKGTVFRMTPTGQITSIYSFCEQANCADGQRPITAPVLGSDGNLYGVTNTGGSHAKSGTIYKMTLDGKITTLHVFSCPTSACADGQYPTGIVEASDGYFYGTATNGGEFNSGTIFRISPTGRFELLHTFCSAANCADGGIPLFPPIQASDGNFYGGTNAGGGRDVATQGGVVYKLTPGGTLTVVQDFCYGFSDTCLTGAYPTRLVQDAKGNFFGTTASGGSYNSGTAFEITSTGQFVGLHRFTYSGGVDAATGLILASDGNLYGVALDNANFAGEPGGHGIIFEITAAGEFATLATFEDCPIGPLFQGTDGSFYGVTGLGGKGNSGYGFGTVYRLSNGLSPFARTVPAAAKAGKTVLILGNNLTGSSSVTFNGVAAKFTVVSDTYIKTTVPAGATTGAVSVVTPTGTLNSNPQFIVTK
jgi:uncharacterized repeat protein (TIGR03803 family)